MGDMPPFMIRTFNAYSSQIDNVTSLRELNQIENSIVEMVDPQVKKALLNKINQKRAEINNNNQVIYEAQVDDVVDYQRQQRIQDDLNNQLFADYMFHNQTSQMDDVFNMNDGIDDMF